MDMVPDGRSPDELARLAEQFAAYVQASYSPLLRVIGVGESVQANGLRVELIAVEIREKGAVVYIRAFGDEDGFRGSAAISVADDVDTHYNVELSSGGGGGRAWKGQYDVVPAPTSQARTLRITVERFDTLEGLEAIPEFEAQALATGVRPLVAVEGPWRFEVELDRTEQGTLRS